jgi:hypothetical protein
MAFVSVSADISRAIARLTGIQRDVEDKAVAMALNKATAKGRTEAKRRIAAEFNVKSNEVNAQLAVVKASAKSHVLTATLNAFGRRRGHRSRNVMMFDARVQKGTGPAKRVRVQMPNGDWRMVTVRQGGGVSVKIKRTGGRKLIPGAFIGNQGRTVFIRTGSDRLPIKAVETVDVPQMFNMRAINKSVSDKMKSEFVIELDRALAYLLKK